MKKFDLDPDGLSTIKPKTMKTTDDADARDDNETKPKLDTRLHQKKRNTLLDML